MIHGIAPNFQGATMNPALFAFARQYAAVVIAALVPVVLTAFLSIPFNLGGHPGEPRPAQSAVERHMT